MNIPNILTAIRIIIIPFFAYSILNEMFILAVILFLAASISDILDGYIARKYNQITEFGKIADPFADKLMQFTAVLTLTIIGKLHVLIVILLGLKEIVLGLGAYILFRKKHVIKGSKWYGKATTVLLNISVVLILFGFDFGKVILWLAIAFGVIAFLMYGLSAKKIIKKKEE